MMLLTLLGVLFSFSTSVIGYDEVSMKPTVVLQPSWTVIYRGETITARCEIQGGGGTQWTYEWRPTRLNRPPSSRTISVTDSGDYSCRGKRDTFYLTQWSDVVVVTVSYEPRRPVLSVSPSWLSPGSSVTLRCEVEDPSAGWRFYWYKAVPDLSHRSYSYELLPGSTTGTEDDSYIIDGQTHTAGYVCRAGRGEPVYYTHYSKIKFVWSADSHPAASLTVNPDRVQHFSSDSVSLTCGGNSAEWRVMWFTDTSILLDCSHWGTMAGTICNIKMHRHDRGVYWCESGSGEFSKAVNVTTQDNEDGIILVSPVHPVTEGDSVSLSCRLRKHNKLSQFSFYHNDKLLQHDGGEQLNISAVSQSDEGFYKCHHSGKMSEQSWMSVRGVSRPENNSSLLLLIIGPVGGFVFIISILILLCCCKSKCFATETTVNQDENQEPVYSSLLHGDVCVYETIRGSKNSADDHQNDYINVRLPNPTVSSSKGLDKRNR